MMVGSGQHPASQIPKVNMRSTQGSNILNDENPTPLKKDQHKEENMIHSTSSTAQSSGIVPLRMTKAISFVLQADQQRKAAASVAA
jgi:hypothetical protein